MTSQCSALNIEEHNARCTPKHGVSEKSINMDALNEEERLIVDTAANKVSDQLKAIDSISSNDSFVVI